jgi:hypothetical protein
MENADHDARAGTYTNLVATPKMPGPGGLAVDEKHGRICVALSRNNSIAVPYAIRRSHHH